jgi:ApaG protein
MDRMSQAQFTCTVQPQYLEDQSNPARNEYAFAYTVSIVNTGAITAQVVARQWLITDATGRTQEVRGLALVGHQPVLKPGEKFEYTSWTSLDTPHGLMQGTFFCMTEDAHHFEAPIEPFTLARSQSLH